MFAESLLVLILIVVLAVLAVGSKNLAILTGKKEAWREIEELLKLVKQYMDDADVVHSKVIEEIRPVVTEAASNTEKTRDIVENSIEPAVVETKQAVSGVVELKEYTHEFRHEFRGVLQAIFLKLAEIRILLEPPPKAREPKP